MERGRVDSPPEHCKTIITHTTDFHACCSLRRIIATAHLVIAEVVSYYRIRILQLPEDYPECLRHNSILDTL